MPPPVITYPSIDSVLSLRYECGHGILPGKIHLVCSPQEGAVNLEGTLSFGETNATLIVLPGCRVDYLDAPMSGTDRVLEVILEDRRWKWRVGPPVQGFFNQLDQHAKLIPRTVRSPYQLAVLALMQMGEPYPGAAAATVGGGAVTTVQVLDRGRGYASPPAVTLSGGGGTGATAEATVAAGQIVGIAVTSGGTGYTSQPRVTVAPPPGFSVDLPAGLAAAPLAPGVPAPGPSDSLVDPTQGYLTLGYNVAPTGTNPPTRWDGTQTGAQALASLAERYGRVVVFDPVTDSASVAPLGGGAGLPDEPALTLAPSLDPDAVPAAVRILGADVRYQTRLRFRAVAEEWDGSHVPLNSVSYAPVRAGQTMRVRVGGGTYAAGSAYSVTVNTTTFTVGAGVGGSLAGVAANLSAQINASGAVNTLVVASVIGDDLFVAGLSQGYEFEVYASGNADWRAVCVRGPVDPNPPASAVYTVTASGPFVDLHTFTITVNGVSFSVAPAGDGTGSGYPATMYELARRIATSTDAAVRGKVSATWFETAVQIEATEGGAGVLTVTSSRTGGTGFATELTRDPAGTGRGFEYASMPAGTPVSMLPAVVPTPRLSWSQAAELAARSVYRRYKLVMNDPGDGLPGVRVPGVFAAGDDTTRVSERHRIVLQDSMPEQIAPRGGDANRIDPVTGQPFAAEYYDGYSRDRRPRCFGSILQSIRAGGLWSNFAGSYLGPNTPPRSEFYLPFRVVDPENHVIEFPTPVFRIMGQAGGTSPNDVVVLPVDLVVETGCLILHPTEHRPLRYTFDKAIAGGTGPVAGYDFPDVQSEVRGWYDDRHNLQAAATVDNYAAFQADAYATQIANTYQTPAGGIAKYIGLLRLSPTGQIRQVLWEIGEAGYFTTASANAEFSRVILPTPARRRAENLPPDPAQVRENLASRGGGAVRNAVESILRGGRRAFD